MPSFSMTIDGAAAASERTFGVINPATGEVFDEAPDCTPQQLDAAMASAQSAYRGWRAEIEPRREALRAAADLVTGAVDELAPTLTAEQGKPLADAKREILGSAIWFKYFADLELPREVIQDDERATVEVLRRPLGVVAAIAP